MAWKPAAVARVEELLPGSSASWPMSSFLTSDAARLPDLLDRPLPGPPRGRVCEGRVGCALGSEDFDHVLDLEAAGAQQADHVAMAEMEVHAAFRPGLP